MTAPAPNPGNLIDLFRIPLLNVAEVVAPAAMVLAVWTELPFASPARPCPWPVLTAACIAAFYLLAAWGYRSSQRTWVGSIVVLTALAHTLRFNYTELVEQPWLSLLVALLAHSTLALLASVLLDAWAKGRPDQRPGETVGRVFGKPLGDTALFSSALTLPVLPLEFWTGGMSIWSLALCLLWLAVIWLVVSWRNRDRGLFAAHQAMLTLAALVATTAWLKGHGWITDLPDDLLRPGNLQAFGIILGLLSLAWIVVRIVLRGDRVAQKLLNPHGPSVDRIVRHAVVCGQLLLVASLLLPGFAEELLPQPSAASVPGVQQVTTGVPQAASGLGAWAVLGVMAIVLVVTLWYRWRISMVGSLLLAATIPWLIAGGFAGQQAVASALRWGLATCFLVCSVAVWQRKGLLQVCGRARTRSTWVPRDQWPPGQRS